MSHVGGEGEPRSELEQVASAVSQRIWLSEIHPFHKELLNNCIGYLSSLNEIELLHKILSLGSGSGAFNYVELRNARDIAMDYLAKNPPPPGMDGPYFEAFAGLRLLFEAFTGLRL